MAENIIGGGYLPPAKPFNVINASGISAEQSLNTLTAIGEGKRNRAHEARQSAAAMEFQQREGERERMFQAQQTAGAHQFAEQQRRKSVESEEYFRTREERFALLQMDHQNAMTALNDEINLAVSQGDHELAVELNRKKGELQKQAMGVGSQITRLTNLKMAYDDMYGKNMTDANGKNVGVKILQGLNTMAIQKASQFQNIQKSLHGVVDRIINPVPVAPPSLGGSFQEGPYPQTGLKPKVKRDGAVEPAGFPQSPPPVESRSPLKTRPDGSVEPAGYLQAPQKQPQAAPLGEVEQAGPPKPEREIPEVGKWTELSGAIAAGASGKGSKEIIQTSLEVMFNALERAVQNPSEARGGPLLKKAVEQYKQAIAQGADQDTLDKALYAISLKVKTAGAVKGAVEGQNMTDAQGSNMENVGKVGASQDAQRLGQMIEWLSQQNDVDQEGKSHQLIKGFGQSDFFDFEKGEPVYKFRDDVMEVFTVLSGASNPEELIDAITNSDPSDDPDSLKFINNLHPDVRTFILKDLSESRRQIEAFKEKEGITPADGSILDLPGLRKQEEDLTWQYKTDVPNQISQIALRDKTKERKKLSEGRQTINKKYQDSRATVESEMEEARRRMLGD